MPPTSEVMAGVSQDSILSGTLASYGVSDVARVSDRGRVAEVYPVHRNVSGLSIRVSPSHPYNAGRAGLGWMREWLQRNVYAACIDCVVWGGDFARRSGIQVERLYSRPSPAMY